MEQADAAQVIDDRFTPGWWRPRHTPVPPAGYAEMVEAMRELQDSLAAAAPDAALVTDITKALQQLTDLVAPAASEEWTAISGFVEALPGRGSSFLPVLHEPQVDDGVLRGRVRFRRFHLGGNGAVHGGTVPLLLDDVMGRFANHGGRPLARTAYLHVDYRHVTPVERDLALEVRVAREDGRKRWVSAVLRDGGTVCVEAEGLWVELRPGQP